MMFRSKATYWDVLILSVFAILITLQPYFMHGKINIFEIGLYLPAIQSVLSGEKSLCVCNAHVQGRRLSGNSLSMSHR